MHSLAERISHAAGSSMKGNYKQLEWPPPARVAVPMKKFSKPRGLPFSYPGCTPCCTAAVKIYLQAFQYAAKISFGMLKMCLCLSSSTFEAIGLHGVSFLGRSMLVQAKFGRKSLLQLTHCDISNLVTGVLPM